MQESATGLQPWKRWSAVTLFAVAMTWVESSVVFYLRTLADRIDPHQPDPMPLSDSIGNAEIIREASTLVMLYAVGWLAGATARSRFGYFLIAFGVWDIFYYLFLRVITGWPGSVLDWDVLFLIPLPWWGPVLAPMLIAGLMIWGGSLLAFYERPNQRLWPGIATIGLNVCGTLLALYVFMADALRVFPEGKTATRTVLPESFNWPLYFVAVILMAAPILEMFLAVRKRNRGPIGPAPVIGSSSA